VRTEQLNREFDLNVRYTVFPLHPETPEAGQSLKELFGGRYDVNALLTRLRQEATDLDLPFGDRSHTYNSRRAQELGKWAEQEGKGAAFRDAVFRAYFADGLNIGRLEVLTTLAAGIGLDPELAAQVLHEDSQAAAVDADWQRARSKKITAVPTVVYGNQKLVGFRPYTDYRQLLIR
jgi:predicted DsbA family dithiol-disulfide isomerase